MPQFNEYTGATVAGIDDDDLLVFQVDGTILKLTTVQMRLLMSIVPIEDVSGTTYTLVAADQGKIKRASNASAKTLTVPSTSGFLLNAPIIIRNHGAGDLSLSVSGSTINGSGTTLTQYQSAVLIPVSTNVWDLYIGGVGGGSGLTQLSTPGNFSMSSPNDDTMEMTWDDVANEDGYTVEIAEDAGFTTGLQTANKGVGVLTHTFTGLTASTTYYGRVKAVGDGATYSDSGYATNSEDTLAAGLVGLNTPGSFTATPASSTQINLTWTDTNSSPNEVDFRVYRNTVNNFGTATLINSPAQNATGYNATGLTASTLYYFWVVAKGNGTTTGDSPAASTSATTNSSGYEAESLAYFTEFATQEGSAMSTPDKNAWNTFVVAAKAAGIYSKFDFFFPLKGVTANGQKVDAIAPGTNALTYTSGTFTHTSMGLKHDGTVSSRATTNLTPITLGGGVNDVHLGAYVTEDATSGYDIGGANLDYGRYTANLYSHANNNTPDGTIGSQTDSLGHTMISRITSTQYYVVRRGTPTTHVHASTGQASANITLLNTGTAPTVSGSGRRLGCAHGGNGLTTTEAATLEGLIEDLMTAWGRNV
jgi:hypothetical protein